MFTLHSQLQADTVLVGYLPLSLVLLCKDANYPWCILVPQRESIAGLHELNKEDRSQFMAESCALSEVMVSLFNPFKMNVAALGNMVPQLHIHHIARFKDDVAWPKPIWGVVDSIEYDGDELSQRVNLIREGFAGSDIKLL